MAGTSNLRGAPDRLTPEKVEQCLAIMDDLARIAPVTIGIDFARGADRHVEATVAVDAGGAHKILCLSDTPGASGTARKAPSAVSSGTATRHIVRAPIAERENGHHTRSPVHPDWITQRFALLKGATLFLRARAILVSPDDRQPLLRRYWVSGMRDPQFAEDVIGLAQAMGWEASL
ncbi:MAG TPA: hypothetical protein VF463_10695 [Sphingobium sp.]